MHQLLLTLDDKTLVGLLDGAVMADKISVPAGEVRRLRVNSRESVTAWRLRPELSAMGYRSVSGDAEHPNLRTGAVVGELYDLADADDSASLAWLLRDSGPGTVVARLERSLRNQDPGDTIRRLIFAREANLERICQRLGVSSEQSDDQIIQQVLWKLGYPLPAMNTVSHEYWLAHRAFERVARMVTGQLDDYASDLRSAAAEYGVALERYMTQAIVYSTWVLLNDHYGSKQPFVYRGSTATAFARERLASAAERESYDGLAVESKLTISSLTNSFGLLARELSAVNQVRVEQERPPSALPRFAGRTNMQRFPFSHSTVFLDLDGDANENIRALLSETTSRIAASQIAEARNSWLHANRNPVKPAAIADALDEVQKAFGRLEDSGLVPKTFEFSRFEVDKWGRGVAVLATTDEEEYRLIEPSQYQWLGLPGVRSHQFIVRAATLGDGAQALRFRQGFDSRYEEYWSEYPKRPEIGTAVGVDRSGSLSSAVQTGTHVASRAD